MNERKKGAISAKLPSSPIESCIKEKFTKKNSKKTLITADHPDFIPEYKTNGAACCDLVANIPPNIHGKKELILAPGHTEKVDCGFSIALPAGWEAQIRARSGLASKGIVITNDCEGTGGTIDEDYRLRIKVIVSNVSRHIIVIQDRERIAQMALKPVWYFDFDSVECMPEADSNRTGGFGSTGNKV